MDIQKVKDLIELLKSHDLAEIEIKTGEDSVKIVHAYKPSINTGIPSAISFGVAESLAEKKLLEEPKVVEVKGHLVKSPMVGTAYLSSAPGSKLFAEIGQIVKIGDTLCLIEAMKMFNKVEADRAGVVSACMIENSQPVEYNQTLFVIEEG